MRRHTLEKESYYVLSTYARNNLFVSENINNIRIFIQRFIKHLLNAWDFAHSQSSFASSPTYFLISVFTLYLDRIANSCLVCSPISVWRLIAREEASAQCLTLSLNYSYHCWYSRGDLEKGVLLRYQSCRSKNAHWPIHWTVIPQTRASTQSSPFLLMLLLLLVLQFTSHS